MASIDRSLPHAEVWGNGAVWLEQGGRRFNLAGDLMSDESMPEAIPDEPDVKPDDEPDAEPAPMSPADKRRATWAAKRAKAEAEAVAPVSELADQTDDQLKALVDIAGGTWKDRDAAVAFLQEK